jgi:chromatin segregation and condensation protein Rec8/ScpA/Scc1 (kleisin family)
MKDILARVKDEIEHVEREKLSEAKVAPVIHIKDVISRIETVIASGKFSFSDVMERYEHAGTPDEKRVVKVEAIVTFLALLELARNGIAMLSQGDNGSILAEKYEAVPSVIE